MVTFLKQMLFMSVRRGSVASESFIFATRVFPFLQICFLELLGFRNVTSESFSLFTFSSL